jgi:hypothetical protein
MNKRAISAIVATVLIILISVAAVTIIWVTIIPMIQNNLDVIDADVQLNVVSSEGYTAYDSVTNMLTVQVKRGADEEVIDEIKITIQFYGGDSLFEVVDSPAPNQLVTYGFRLDSGDVPVSVSVSPIVIKDSGEKEGIASSYVDFSEGLIEEDLGVEVFDGVEGHSPTCVDGVKNGEEEGIDCGGDCPFNCISVDGLISWWKFEGDTSDSMGNYDGVDGGVTYVDGKMGEGISGFTSFNKITVSSSLDYASTDMAISFWMKVDDYAAPTRQNPIGKAYGGDGTFTLETSGYITFFFGSSGANAPPYTPDVSGDRVIVGTWEHWVITRNRATRQTQWYKNGVASGPASIYLSSCDPRHSNFVLSFGDDYVSPLNGAIDEVMIFNKTLSASEVLEVYNYFGL